MHNGWHMCKLLANAQNLPINFAEQEVILSSLIYFEVVKDSWYFSFFDIFEPTAVYQMYKDSMSFLPIQISGPSSKIFSRAAKHLTQTCQSDTTAIHS